MKQSDSDSKKVLVVDDNDEILWLVDRQLNGEDFDIVTANSGHAAVRWCEENGRPDLLLTDVCMPELDGPGLYQELNARYPDIPVVFMGGTVLDAQDRMVGPLLQKPFCREQLISVISNSLHAQPPDDYSD